MPTVPSLIIICLVLYWLGVLIFIVSEDREPTTTLLWLIFIIVLPVFGLVFYFFFGRDWPALARRHKRYAEFRALVNEALPPVYERHSDMRQALRKRYDGSFVNRIIHSIEKENGVKPLPVRDITIYPSGAEKFAALKKDLASAKKFIHLQYFIWEHDKLTGEITEILLDRLNNGVEVRIMYDFAGSLSYKKDEIKKLGRAGADYSPDIRNVNKINYRNHRKIVIIDGDIGYTGGMNMGQEYIDGKPKYDSWRDTHLRITGQGVADLQRLFAARWYDDRRESLLDERYLPAPEENSGDATMIQVVSQGVEDWWESARRTHGIAISGATNRVWLQSPYFVPDHSTYDAMIGAALSGVDTRLMMTGVPDNKTAWCAAHSYWPRFLEAGGRVFLYEAGFFHAKTLVVDSQVCSIGTMNLDIRSLRLHKENMVWIYDEDLAKAQENIFIKDLQECREVTLEELMSASALKRFTYSACRLASNLL
ncbi:MAG: cardiolipin synthase [Actinomycetota bacterium]